MLESISLGCDVPVLCAPSFAPGCAPASGAASGPATAAFHLDLLAALQRGRPDVAPPVEDPAAPVEDSAVPEEDPEASHPTAIPLPVPIPVSPSTAAQISIPTPIRDAASPLPSTPVVAPAVSEVVSGPTPSRGLPRTPVLRRLPQDAAPTPPPEVAAQAATPAVAPAVVPVPRDVPVSSDGAPVRRSEPAAGDTDVVGAPPDAVATIASSVPLAAAAHAPSTGSAVVPPASRLPAPYGLGMQRTDRVRQVQQHLATRPVQHLAIDLDDARVSVRVRNGKVGVEVVSDPSGVLDGGWARQVERTLDHAVRAVTEPAGPLPRHDAAATTNHDPQSRPGDGTQRGHGRDTDDAARERPRRAFVIDPTEEDQR